MRIIMVFWLSTYQATFSHPLGLLSTFYSLGCSGGLSCLLRFNTLKHRMSFAFERLVVYQKVRRLFRLDLRNYRGIPTPLESRNSQRHENHHGFWLSTYQAIFSHPLGLLSTFYSLGCSGRLSSPATLLAVSSVRLRTFV